MAIAALAQLCIACDPKPVGGLGSDSDILDSSNLPGYAELAAEYNERAAGLGAMWARAVVEVEQRNEKSVSRDQGEGHVQVVVPSRVAVSVGKLGEVLFWFGSDESRYWLIGLGNDDRSASFGRHDRIAEHAQAGSVVVSPRLLPALLGIAPLPAVPGPSSARGVASSQKDDQRWGVIGRVAHAADSAPDTPGIVLRVRGPLGESIRYTIDAETLEPRAVEITDSNRTVLLRSELSDYRNILNKRDGNVQPRAASRVRVDAFALKGAAGRGSAKDAGMSLRLWLSAMEEGIRSRPIDPRVFDLEYLVAQLRVAQVVDVDEELDASRDAAKTQTLERDARGHSPSTRTGGIPPTRRR